MLLQTVAYSRIRPGRKVIFSKTKRQKVSFYFNKCINTKYCLLNSNFKQGNPDKTISNADKSHYQHSPFNYRFYYL